ncbi:hypothetical protein MASR2M79_15600 [Aminivibrio sp.]
MLSDEDKKTVTDVARVMQEERWKVAEKDEQLNMKKLADIGVEVITLTDDELEALREKNSKEVWPVMYAEIGSRR